MAEITDNTSSIIADRARDMHFTVIHNEPDFSTIGQLDKGVLCSSFLRRSEATVLCAPNQPTFNPDELNAAMKDILGELKPNQTWESEFRPRNSLQLPYAFFNRSLGKLALTMELKSDDTPILEESSIVDWLSTTTLVIAPSRYSLFSLLEDNPMIIYIQKKQSEDRKAFVEARRAYNRKKR